MKKILKFFLPVLLFGVAISVSQCAKKKEETKCKTCKAFASGPDQQTIQQNVCTPEEEQAFRNAHAGREISCQ